MNDYKAKDLANNLIVGTIKIRIDEDGCVVCDDDEFIRMILNEEQVKAITLVVKKVLNESKTR